jgi:DNA repair protein RadC
MKYVTKYRLSLVRDGRLTVPESVVGTPVNAARILNQLAADSDREGFWVLALDVRNQVLGVNVVALGGVTSCPIDPRNVFKFALLANAVALILGHNHVSGQLTPSHEDLALTRRLKSVGDEIGIQVLDHVIVDGRGGWLSLRETGGM